MLILLPYYALLGLICLTWAQVPFWLLKLKKPDNVFFDMLFGMVFLSIISMLFVIGGPINLLTQGIFVFSTFAIVYLQREEFRNRIEVLFHTLGQFSKTDLILIAGIIIPIVYQSAQATKINDNGAYYQASIAWMEQYGVVKGLANIYPALGLFSGWHSLTALFDLNQLGFGSYHQINGFLLSIFSLWILREWKINLGGLYKMMLLGMLLFASVFGFFFLSAPNADLPVICFSAIMSYHFIRQRESYHPLIWFIFSLGIFIIKPPASVAIVLTALILFGNKFTWKSKINSLILVVPILGALFFKNVMLSGYLLYPMNQPDLLELEWKVPKNWNDLYRQGIVSWGVQDKYEIKDWNLHQQAKGNRLSKWLFRSGYKGFMNKFLFINWVWIISILILVIFKKRREEFQFLLTAMLLIFFLIFEWMYLSQYRLMLASSLSILIFNIYFTYSLIGNWADKKINQVKIYGFTGAGIALILWVIAFIPFSAFNKTSRNQSITQSDGFKTRYLIEPWHQFDNGPIYTNRFNQMVFYYYPERVYCWDCPVPCVSKSHHDFLLKNLGLEISPIGKKIEDGFKLVVRGAETESQKEQLDPKTK